MSFTNLWFARVWYCRTVPTVSQRHFLYIYPSHSSRTWINIQIECTCASEVRTPQKQNESKCWILSVHFFECQVSLSYTIFQYTPICAEFSSMLTPIKANQSLIASISSSTGPCRQCRGDPSRKVTITLLVESENRQWKRELTKLWLCAMISNNRLSTGLNNLSTQEIPPSSFIAISSASVFARFRARFRRTRTALRGMPAASLRSSVAVWMKSRE